MKDNDSSERHQNNALKVVIAYAKHLGSDATFYDISRKEQITRFLDTKIKSVEEDPDKKWITTWNHYLHRIKHLLRWLHNQREKEDDRQNKGKKNKETKSLFRDRNMGSRRVFKYSKVRTILTKQGSSNALLGHGR